MADSIYDLSLPILHDDALSEEEKTDRLEELLRKQANLSGKALEDAVLGVLWRHKAADGTSSSPPPSRHTIIRRPSPAPWHQQRSSTPSASSQRSASASANPPPGSASTTAPSFMRPKSSAAPSPFTSPRPSPRLAYATPAIPHSPSLNAYQFSDASPPTETYGDFGSDNVDWLVNDDASSNTSYGDSGFTTGATEYMQPYTVDMSPYDMLRSVLREERSDDELEKILDANGYDFSLTITALMEAQDMPEQNLVPEPTRSILVGKSMSPSSRPRTPVGQAKTPVVCRYFANTGHCARADCRFSHDLTSHICKYWLAGNCLAGDACIYSHDPTALFSRMAMNGEPPPQYAQPNFHFQDYDSFPALQPTTSNPYEQPLFDTVGTCSPPSLVHTPGHFTLNPSANFIPTGPRGRSGSRPSSRPTSRAPTPSAPAVHDDEAFPTLGSAAANRQGKRHHGKRGHGHKESSTPVVSSIADVVRRAPSPSMLQTRRGLLPTKSYTGSRENSTAAQAIPPPEHVPWLETGGAANRDYLKARAEAFKHGGLRNKFLQSAAQAWNRNDARGAKALSLRGQNENALMKEAHREAAKCLYDERNRNAGLGKELYVDLHGLHPEEAVSYLTTCLLDHTNSSRPVYAICGTGHHSKNGKDKVGKAVRVYLTEWRYAFREFSVPGDRNNVGGILGIDPSSYDKELAKRGLGGESSEADSGVGIDTKVRIRTAEDTRDETKGS